MSDLGQILFYKFSLFYIVLFLSVLSDFQPNAYKATDWSLSTMSLLILMPMSVINKFSSFYFCLLFVYTVKWKFSLFDFCYSMVFREYCRCVCKLYRVIIIVNFTELPLSKIVSVFKWIQIWSKSCIIITT